MAVTERSGETPDTARAAMAAQNADAEISASIYRELRRIAAAKMSRERGNHTLQPTALVHEAFMRLANQPEAVWKDRARILALASHAMRHILVDHARAHAADKRGAGQVQITLDDGLSPSSNEMADILAVDEALIRLEAFDARQAEVLEMHFFAGLTFEEIASQLGVSLRTVKSDCSMARAWLHQQLSGK